MIPTYLYLDINHMIILWDFMIYEMKFVVPVPVPVPYSIVLEYGYVKNKKTYIVWVDCNSLSSVKGACETESAQHNNISNTFYT